MPATAEADLSCACLKSIGPRAAWPDVCGVSGQDLTWSGALTVFWQKGKKSCQGMGVVNMLSASNMRTQ